MSTRHASAGCLARATALLCLAAAAAAAAQGDPGRAFTSTGASCDRITWSAEALARYPGIAGACQDVMERDGRYYVKFSGAVRSVADRGRSVTVDFKDGSRIALTPPENLSLYVDGRPRSTRELRRGDELTFFVPQDQLAASAAADRAAESVVGITVIPIARVRVAQATPEADAAPAELPATASALPAMALGGVLLMCMGALLGARRHRAFRMTRPRAPMRDRSQRDA